MARQNYSLAPGWESNSTLSLRDLRMALNVHFIQNLKANKLKTCDQIRGLTNQVRAELKKRAEAGDLQAA